MTQNELASPGPKSPGMKQALKDALLEIRRLRTELAKARTPESTPVAVVGMACRFPGGANDPESFWRLLSDGECPIQTSPENRWDLEAWFDDDPDAAGRLYTQHGGYLSNVDAFDPDVFGISPREAKGLDPQQRMLLEVTWEALERSGLSTPGLHGSDTGVYIGMSTDDYAELTSTAYESIDAWNGLGTMRSVAAGRLAYTFGLQGPALLFDTSCSSSLTALHQACNDLRAGVVSAAIAGGVNLILTPRSTITLCRLKALSPDGLCRTFDAAANGYVRGEGCGVVVLKTLEQAQLDGDVIHAVIRGSAINHDGQSNGLTAPNGKAQERLLRRVLQESHLEPSQVQYIETHGTGTSLGDPIEAQALANVYGPGHSKDLPLRIGSVKTNIGHLEAAAGIAAFIKTVLSLQHAQIAPHLHFKNPSPFIDWEHLPLAVPIERQAWEPPQGGDRRRAAVSAFGMSGTNVHLIVEESPDPGDVSKVPPRPCNLLTLTAKSDAALDAVVANYVDLLQTTQEPRLADLCYSANSRRIPLDRRAAFVASSDEELLCALQSFATSRAGSEGGDVLHTPSPAPPPPCIGFLFTGQGSQYLRMGSELYDSQPAFSDTLDRCNETLEPILGRSLTELIDGKSDLLDQTQYTQPVLFSLQCALYRLWDALGIRPEAVMGHSVGEYAAAWAAGVFELEEGLRLIAERARLMQEMPGSGSMVSVLGPQKQTLDLLSQSGAKIDVAAFNGPEHIVLTGDGTALRTIVAKLKKDGLTCRPLTVSHAFHSSHVEGMLADFETFASNVDFRDPSIPMISNLTGRPIEPGQIGPQYWSQHTRQAVQFESGIQSMKEVGCRLFVEIGPTPVLNRMGRAVLKDHSIAWLASLRHDVPDWRQILRSAGEMYVRNVAVDFEALDRPFASARCRLPTYPFQRQRYWVDAPLPGVQASAGLQISNPIPQTSEDEIYYHLEWEPVEISNLQRRRETIESWIILSDRVGIGNHLAKQIRQTGQQVTCVNVNPASSEMSPTDCARDALLKISPPESGRIGIVCLASIDHTTQDQDLAAAVTTNCETLMGISQHLRSQAPGGFRLWVATRGAVAIDAKEPIADLSSSPLWGFGRSLALEFPECWGGLVDLDHQDGSAESADRLWQVLVQPCTEGQIAFRRGKAHLPRVLPAPSTISPVSIRSDATYLISGGLGALGLRMANWLADHGAKNLLLFGRRGLTNSSERAVADLTARGVHVLALSADVTSRQDMQDLHERVTQDLPPVRGIFHAAGLSGLSTITELSVEDLRSVLAPKVAGSIHIDELARRLDLDFFVLFSSIASLWGAKGQAHYAAANSFLDAIAANRRAQNLPTVSVWWGPWDGGGMVQDDDRATLDRMGIRPLSAAQTSIALCRVLAAQNELAVVDVDWFRLRPLFESAGVTGLLSRVSDEEKIAPEWAAESDQGLREWELTPDSDKPTYLRSLVTTEVGRVLGLPEKDRPDPGRGFFDLGMDSIMAIDLKKRLEGLLRIEFPATAAFDYPTANSLADYLRESLPTGKESADPVETATDHEPQIDVPSGTGGDIGDKLARLEAIIGRNENPEKNSG